MQKQATRLDNESTQSQETVFNSLSKQLNVPINTLRAQQTSTSFGPGQLLIANSLATAGGKTFDQIAQEFKSGKGWGVIAKENNLNLGRVVSDLKRANKQVQEDRAEQARANAQGSTAGNSSQSGGSSSHGAASQQGSATGHGAGQPGPRGKH